MIRGKSYPIKERRRIYRFVGAKVELENVEELIISNSGNHRLKTADGRKHIVPPGWVHIEIDRDEDWME